MQNNTGRTHFFYQNGKLISLTTGEQGHSIFRTADVPLAEQQTQGKSSSALLGTDLNGSVLNVQERT